MSLSRAVTAILCIVTLSGVVGEAAAAQMTPVQKVLQLLEGMVNKGTQDRQEEQVEFAKFKAFCDNTVSAKEKAIADAEDEIASLKADVEKSEADAEQLGREISAHDEDIATWEGDMTAAQAVRDIENAEFLKNVKEYEESIDAVEKGLSTIEAEQGDVKSAALLQLRDTHLIPAHSRKAILKFLEEDETGRSSAPEANAYESATTGITNMLTGLGRKFEAEKGVLEKKEVEAKHAFDMLASALRSSIDAAKGARTEKMEAKAAAKQDAANAKGSIADASSTKDADSKYVSDMKVECQQKSTDFANKQELRAEEIVAVKKAMEIISGGSVAGASEKHLPQLMQSSDSDSDAVPQEGTSFAQLRGESTNQNTEAVQMQLSRVSMFLKKQAVSMNSRVLAAVAIRMSSDPFKKVKKMIKDLIVKLMEEAGEEAEHKGFCDSELKTNKATRTEKTEASEMLHAEIDELQASTSALTEQIAQLTKELAELDAAVAEATQIRDAEKVKNTETIKDAQDAQEAVEQALKVLNDFYSKSEAASLVQEGNDAAGGVIGMIEVIQSDFARLETETVAEEEESQKEFNSFVSDSKVDRTTASSDLEHKEGSKQDQEQALQQRKAELEGTTKELSSAMAYYEKLKPQCVSTGVSFEDRVARRKEEIESLQTALRVLNGEDIAL